MTTPKLCPETIKACIEAIDKAGAQIYAGELTASGAKQALKALLPDPARELATKFALSDEGRRWDPEVDEGCVLFARWLLSSGYLKESEG